MSRDYTDALIEDILNEFVNLRGNREKNNEKQLSVDREKSRNASLEVSAKFADLTAKYAGIAPSEEKYDGPVLEQLIFDYYKELNEYMNAEWIDKIYNFLLGSGCVDPVSHRLDVKEFYTIMGRYDIHESIEDSGHSEENAELNEFVTLKRNRDKLVSYTDYDRDNKMQFVISLVDDTEWDSFGMTPPYKIIKIYGITANFEYAKEIWKKAKFDFYARVFDSDDFNAHLECTQYKDKNALSREEFDFLADLAKSGLSVDGKADPHVGEIEQKICRHLRHRIADIRTYNYDYHRVDILREIVYQEYFKNTACSMCGDEVDHKIKELGYDTMSGADLIKEPIVAKYINTRAHLTASI